MSKTIRSRTLVLGIGNPILHDDGIGPLVVQRVQERFYGVLGRFRGTDVDFKTTNLSGVLLMDLLAGYDSLVIIDAITRGEKPGTMHWLKPHDFGSGNGSYSQHRVGILQALKLGTEMGQPMPGEIDILAIEARDVTTFGEEMTPEVEEAIPAAVSKVLHFLENSRNIPPTGLNGTFTKDK